MSANCVIFTYYTGEISKVSKNYNQLWRNFTQKCISLEICKNFTYKNSTTQYKKKFYSPPRPGFYYIIYTVLQCDLPPLRPHCGEAPGPGFEPGTGDLESGTQNIQYLYHLGCG